MPSRKAHETGHDGTLRKPANGFQDRCLKPLGHPSLLCLQSLSSGPPQNKPRIGTHLAPQPSGCTKCCIDGGRGLTVVFPEQVRVGAQGDVRLRLSEPMADGDNIDTGIDQLAGVRMPQRVDVTSGIPIDLAKSPMRRRSHWV